MKLIEIRDTYLFVYYDEANDVNTLISVMEEIAEIRKKENTKKLLIDLRNMAGEPKFLDRFKLGIAGVKILIGFSKVAIVYKKVESNQFAETVANNRGLPTHITHDMDEARRWLKIDR